MWEQCFNQELKTGPTYEEACIEGDTRPKTEAMCTHCLGGYKGAPLYLKRQCGLIAFVFIPVGGVKYSRRVNPVG